MENMSWRVRLGLLLVLLSVVLYSIQFAVFRDPHLIFFYIGIDLAFIPIEVLVVVLVIERAISEKEKETLLEKMNMVIGTFFSDVGTDLLNDISEFDPQKGKIRENLKVKDIWSKQDFMEAAHKIKNYDLQLQDIGTDMESISFLESLKIFLLDKREFLLRLLENQNLLEHDSFTDLLWAVFHLSEELDKRTDLTRLPHADYKHLKFDIERAYNSLIMEWLHYMEHLMNNYPYLFSLALRVNPFDPDATVEIPD